MIDKRILEAIRHGRSKAHQFFFRQSQCRNDLFIDCLIHVTTDDIILHTVSYNVLSGKVSTEYHGSMSAV